MRNPFQRRHKPGNPSVSSTISTPPSTTSPVPAPSPLATGDQLQPFAPDYKVTPLEIRELNELIRRRYSLDLEIWQLGRGCRPVNRPPVEEKMQRSDATLQKILTIVRTWDNPMVWESQEDWHRIKEIRARLEKEGKINWAVTKPWDIK